MLANSTGLTLLPDNTMDEANFTGAKATCPEPVTSDFIKIAILSTLFIIGAPLNALILYKLVYRAVAAKTLSRHSLLTLHLNITDLMVIFLYAPSETIWTITYKWLGGKALCKLMAFVNMMAFQISSNVVVCISVERALTVLIPDTPMAKSRRRINIMLIASWVSAATISLPQLYFWEVYEPCPQWSQCVTTFVIERYTTYRRLSASGNWTNNNAQHFDKSGERAYTMYNVIIVFWLPFAFIAVGYGLILWQIWRKLAMPHTFQPLQSMNSVTLHEMKYSSSSSSGSSRNRTRRQVDAYQPRLSTMSVLSHGAQRGLKVRQAYCKTLRVAVLIISAYVVCWLPYNICALWMAVHPLSYEQSGFHRNLDFLNALVVVNSVVNPLLYGWYAAQMNRYKIPKPAKLCLEFLHLRKPKHMQSDLRHAYA